MILFKLDIILIILVKHARKRTNRALKNHCLDLIFCSVKNDRIGSKAETP